MIRGDSAGLSFSNSAHTGWRTGIVCFGISKIRHSAVMSDNATGHLLLVALGTFQSTGGGVVNLFPAVKTLLKVIGIFADVMGFS